MRLLVVTSQFPIAGEATRGRPIVQTVRELARLATVHVVSPVAVYPRWARPGSYVAHAPGPVEGLDIDVEYRAYPALPAVSRPFNGYLAGRAVVPALERFAPDVVLSYWLYPDAYGAMHAARRAGIPLVAGARGSDIRVRDVLSKRLTRSVVRHARRLLVVSQDLGRLAVRDYAADPRSVQVIPNGCDASIFRIGDRAAARAALEIAPDAEVVLYVGRLVPEKGLRELLSAYARLAETRSALELVLVGSGPMEDELRSHAAHRPGMRIRTTGALAPARVAQWMTAANLVSLPSYSEGHPNVLVEALACGRPVVATPVGGIPEVVDPTCGELVPPRDAEALASGLDRVLSGDWDETALSKRFSRSWSRVAEETLEQCRCVLRESRKR